jgi:hypothetical protein
MKRISVNVTPEQAARLQVQAALTGVPRNEQIRRAINLALFANAQGARKTSHQPVLFSPKQETR